MYFLIFDIVKFKLKFGYALHIEYGIEIKS